MRGGLTTHFVLHLLPGAHHRFVGPFPDWALAVEWAQDHIGDVALWKVYWRSVCEGLGMTEAVRPEEAA